MSDERPSDLVTAVAAAGNLLRGAAREAGTTVPDLDVEALYNLGGDLDELTCILASITARCSTHVAQLSDGRILRDDSDTHDPAARCAQAADYLHQVAQHLEGANEAARQYHNTISHIGVQVQL